MNQKKLAILLPIATLLGATATLGMENSKNNNLLINLPIVLYKGAPENKEKSLSGFIGIWSYLSDKDLSNCAQTCKAVKLKLKDELTQRKMNKPYSFRLSYFYPRTTMGHKNISQVSLKIKSRNPNSSFKELIVSTTHWNSNENLTFFTVGLNGDIHQDQSGIILCPNDLPLEIQPDLISTQICGTPGYVIPEYSYTWLKSKPEILLANQNDLFSIDGKRTMFGIKVSSPYWGQASKREENIEDIETFKLYFSNRDLNSSTIQNQKK